MAARTLISKLPFFLAARSARSTLHRLRPIVAVADSWRRPIARVAELRAFSTRPTTSSLNDPTPNWSNRPPKETILLDGCDFEHWLVVVDPPEPNMTRDEIIDSYIKKLAEVVGSEEEARMKIYSVSTKHYFAFGALVSEEVSYKIKALSKVRWVLPDSYLDVRNKDYGGEPFIDGQAVPYDPKYHEEWVRNNARANERNRRNDRPRNNDRSRNFDRRRENMQQNYQSRPPPPNQDFQNPVPPRDGPPMPNSAPPMSGPPSTTPPSTMPPRNMPPMQGSTLQNGPPMPNSGVPPTPNREFNSGGPPRAYPNQMPNPQNSYPPTGPGYQGNPGYQGGNPASPNQGYGPNQGYQGGYNGGSPNYQHGGSPNYQQGGAPNYQQSRYQPQGGSPGYSQAPPNYTPGGQGGVGQAPPSYTPGGQGGVSQAPPSYTPGEQGGVGGPSYQQAPPSYQQGGQVGGPYQGNVPGRD